MATHVECKLIREGGTFASTPDNVEYHFAPQDDGAHVAAIDNDDHVDHFLSIREGYRLYRGAAKVAAPAPVAAEVTAEPEAEPVAEAPASAAPAADERAELAAEYERLYGEAPHNRTGIKKLRELIAAKQTV